MRLQHRVRSDCYSSRRAIGPLPRISGGLLAVGRRGARASKGRTFHSRRNTPESAARFFAFAHDIFRPLVGSKPQIDGMPHFA